MPAILPVDLLGKCADYTAISEVAQRAWGQGALRCRRVAGSAASRDVRPDRFGDAAILSFNGNKVMTTSCWRNAADATTRRWPSMRDSCRPRRASRLPHYEHTEVGYNYRMTNVLAALGLAQLARLDEMIARRRAHREDVCRALCLRCTASRSSATMVTRPTTAG